MAVYHPYTVKCTCEQSFVVPLARGINVQRTPELKQKIIDGKFHRATCPRCKRTFTVEKEFSYTDLGNNIFIKVKPVSERHLWKQASLVLDKEVAQVPGSLSRPSGRSLRVVFGLGELREKIIAADYNLDDRIVELLKVLLTYEHPFLLQQPRVRISLDSITSTAIEFHASFDHEDKQFRLGIPRGIADPIIQDDVTLKNWVNYAHPASNLFDLKDDHWVNMWRWSPQPSALDRLKRFAEEVTKGKDIDTGSADFKSMVSQIPRGSHLPSWAKKDLTTLFNYARKTGLDAVQDSLFEVRFDKDLEDDWAKNDDLDDIATLWKLFKDLPETHIEGNSYIRQLQLVDGGGGVYDPSTHDIEIGAEELPNQESFEDVVRHEIGHAVHEKNNILVNRWLTTAFGWQMFNTSNADINEWVNLMGGWGNCSALEQAEIQSYLTEAVGPGSLWESTAVIHAPANHPWNRPDFGPRLAFMNSGNYWYEQYPQWYRANGKAFFLNFWYGTLCVVDEAALALVAKMPSSYAAMSHFEFFAELYALYFDLDDPLRKNIPATVMKWLDENIGSIPHPAMPALEKVARKSFDWIRRPGY